MTHKITCLDDIKEALEDFDNHKTHSAIKLGGDNGIIGLLRLINELNEKMVVDKDVRAAIAACLFNIRSGDEVGYEIASTFEKYDMLK